jgi:hypothetical protein
MTSRDPIARFSPIPIAHSPSLGSRRSGQNGIPSQSLPGPNPFHKQTLPLLLFRSPLRVEGPLPRVDEANDAKALGRRGSLPLPVRVAVAVSVAVVVAVAVLVMLVFLPASAGG